MVNFGIDFGYTLPWWKRLLNWLRLTKYRDASIVAWKRQPDGNYEAILHDQFFIDPKNNHS